MRETKVSRIFLAVLVRGLAEHVVYVVAFNGASRRAAKIGSAAARSAFRLIYARTFCRALRRLMDVGRVGVEALGAAEDGTGRRIAGSTLRHGRRRPHSSVLRRTLPLIRVLADDWNFFLPPAQNHAELAGSLRQ